LTSIREALKTLKEDKRLGIFPEGTRNKNSTEILEIKEGTAMFAVKGKAVITPVIIYDRLKMFKRNYAIVGNPIDLSEFYDERFTEEISKKCSKIIRDKMVELQMELFAKVEELNK
ncbi:MAG: 1-acyl-sn-glycerol-3-phosphate acyltransferase, partial [Clostridia bacterium]|nr:1-acyl-sn-glycerol-3-phosphate acyltransferase [Clostridia bacterium]